MYENSITSCKYYSFGNTSAKKNYNNDAKKTHQEKKKKTANNKEHYQLIITFSLFFILFNHLLYLVNFL